MSYISIQKGERKFGKNKGYKRGLYERSGVREYWIVDIRNKSVDVHRLTDEGYVLEQVYILHSPSDLELLTEEKRKNLPHAVQSCIFPDLEISLEDVFENV